ncbi:DUF3293 domain-containing protein [Aliikangiella maris]
MEQQLIQAYQLAQYVVRIGHIAYHFKVNQNSEVLAKLLKLYQTQHAIFITAFNPASQQLPLDINLQQHQLLKAKLQQQLWSFLPGYGGCENNLWPKELSWLVFGVERQQAYQLAYSFKQNAFLWITQDQPVKLLVYNQSSVK